jgi:hypothetical protein
MSIRGRRNLFDRIIADHSGELAGEIDMSGEHLPQAHEGAHDFHVDQDGPPAPQDARQHRDALFGEGIRGGAAQAAPT